ncbi:MAG TPA: hypothetical protein VLQ45_12605 [Thermoanaerobaculia bacterium]|nr:hypothetical protein [Thermoanaerobaculia bacterium]
MIHQTLSPYLGKLMASTAAVAHCRDLGISGTLMEQPQVDQLLEKLSLGLVIFLGKEKSTLVVAAMRREISVLREVTH